MLVSGKGFRVLHRGEAMTPFVEQPEGPGGPGRRIERRFGLWRWKTWASDNVMASRVRSGWSLRRARALTATSDALDDYKLWMHLWRDPPIGARSRSPLGRR